jgi:hypothetical protein
MESTEDERFGGALESLFHAVAGDGAHLTFWATWFFPSRVSPSAPKKSMRNIRNYVKICENIMKINDLHKLILRLQKVTHPTANELEETRMV